MYSVLFKFYGLLQYVDFALNYCRHILPVLQQLQCNFEESIAPFLQVSHFYGVQVIFVSVLQYFIVPGNFSGFG